jgi:hypothetical protein
MRFNQAIAVPITVISLWKIWKIHGDQQNLVISHEIQQGE